MNVGSQIKNWLLFGFILILINTVIWLVKVIAIASQVSVKKWKKNYSNLQIVLFCSVILYLPWIVRGTKISIHNSVTACLDQIMLSLGNFIKWLIVVCSLQIASICCFWCDLTESWKTVRSVVRVNDSWLR